MQHAVADRRDAGAISGRLYFPQIDGLRFLAFILVYISHFYHPKDFFPPGSTLYETALFLRINGWIGVDIFLVLSSFLIFSLLLSERRRTGTVSIKAFYIRRALRIWPLYFPYLIFAMGRTKLR